MLMPRCGDFTGKRIKPWGLTREARLIGRAAERPPDGEGGGMTRIPKKNSGGCLVSLVVVYHHFQKKYTYFSGDLGFWLGMW